MKATSSPGSLAPEATVKSVSLGRMLATSAVSELAKGDAAVRR